MPNALVKGAGTGGQPFFSAFTEGDEFQPGRDFRIAEPPEESKLFA
jgi:hypothetical protein